jgi:single-strand DNA-binding protein
VNRLFLIGNICNDLTLEETPSGVSILRFGLAVKRDYARGDEERQTDFFNCTAWRGTAETIARYCKKGDKLCVEGKIEFRDYEDNQGIKRRATDVVVDKTEFLGVKKERSEEADETETRTAKRRRPTLTDMSDDIDIPF